MFVHTQVAGGFLTSGERPWRRGCQQAELATAGSRRWVGDVARSGSLQTWAA